MKKTFALLFTLMVLSMPSCDVLNEAQKVGNLVNCSFNLKSVEGLSLAGVNVQNIQSVSNLSIMNAAQLATAVMGNSLPLSFTLNVDAKNPNATPAGMSKMEWILFIDDIEMTRGNFNKKITIPAKNVKTTIPIQMNVDLKKALSGKSGDALLNFAMNLAGNGNKPTRFALQVKPTIKVGDYALSYPGYLTIKAQ